MAPTLPHLQTPVDTIKDARRNAQSPVSSLSPARGRLNHNDTWLVGEHAPHSLDVNLP
jgi:hypothetical protein